MSLSPEWNTVTPFSRRVALLVFLILPFWGFFLGMKYMELYSLQHPPEKLSPVYAPTPDPPVPVTTTTPSARAGQLAQCISDQSTAARKSGVGYEKGSILVAFTKDTSLQAALSVIDSYNLKIASSSDMAATYATEHWLVVDVPTGEEWHWVCILKGESMVKYVDVNRLFTIHE